MQLCKAMCRWGQKKGYFARNPIADSETIRREKMARRSRRLPPGEEQKLLKEAPAHLQRLIIAAVETACRRGELLSLTWDCVDLKKRELTIRSEHAKDREQHILPISSRLAAVIEMVRTDPDGREYPPSAYVFGELGRRLKTNKKAWETAVLKAHGYKPEWVKNGTMSSDLTETASRHQFALPRSPARSRLRFIEAGWPIHHVQEMLGHASLEQTSTYLNVTGTGLQESMWKFDQARSRGITASQTATTGQPPLSHDAQENAPEPLIN